jgi:hypothetical protein
MLGLLLAIAASALVVLSGPFIGQLNNALQNAFPGQHLRIIAIVVVAPALIGLGAAVARIRELRLLRYAALALAIALALTYVAVMQPLYTEQFHLTEYGLLTFLFYRVWRWRGDTTTFVLPIVAALVAGMTDEWFQWFIPSRVGELRDVLLNGVGILAGLLFAIALHPPASLRAFADDRSRRHLAAGMAVLTVAAAIFLQSVHLGYDVATADIGRFSSRYSEAALRELSADRSARWAAAPPVATPAISREDHYLSEAMFHVQRRNEAVGDGELRSAWQENLILERFYAPVLVTAGGVQWPPEQRASVEASLATLPADAPDGTVYVSDAYPLPIYTWDRRWFWAWTAALLAAIALLSRVRRRRAGSVAAV